MTVRVSEPSRRIAAERLVLLAWPRAILLQLAHPLIAAAVARHSSFRGSLGAALSRFHHTVGAMLAITFGTDAERERAIEAIRVIHRRVNGNISSSTGPFAAGARYTAEDPALLLWVHATLVESMVIVYEQLVAPLTEAERDVYCEDSAEVAIALGARADDVPHTWGALLEYLDAQYASGAIVVGADARALLSSLLAPVSGIAGRVFVTPLVSLIAIGQLPPSMRRQYGAPWGRARACLFRLLMSACARIRRIVPMSFATWQISRRATGYTSDSAEVGANAHRPTQTPTGRTESMKPILRP